jgi:DNA-binding protein YbaB
MAGPFGQIGELMKMRSEAMKMKKKMEKTLVKGESRDGRVVVEINGLNELLNVEIADELMSPDKKRNLVNGLIQAMEKAKKELEKEMAKDFDINDLKGMLGR